MYGRNKTDGLQEQKMLEHSQFVGQEGRREGAKGDLVENGVTFHQISSPNCELSRLCERDRQTEGDDSSSAFLLVQSVTGKNGLPLFCRYLVEHLTFPPLC